jgi:glycosyltransferase involved in cell wall biosynthesis
MNTLRVSKDKIFDVKNQVETNSRGIYSRQRINDRAIDTTFVSIVMTSCNRSPQVYYTLKTIAQSDYKNIQVVLVDDSSHDPVLPEKLSEYPFVIDFITINRSVKCWHNPCVNYNIGFKFVEGGKVLVQNGEVCHIGDVVSHLVSNLMPNSYSAYDVRTTPSYEANTAIYGIDKLTIDILHSGLMGIWYQGRSNNRSFHFLAGMDRACLDKIGGGFSYDYTYGSDYDDDDFIMRIRAAGIHIAPFFGDVALCGGIHLFHGSAHAVWNNGVEFNQRLFEAKRNYLNRTGVYVDVSSDYDSYDSKFALL